MHRVQILMISLAVVMMIGIGWVVVQGVAQSAGAFLPGIYMSPSAMLAALGLMALAGIIAGIFPALQAMRLSIIDALARA